MTHDHSHGDRNAYYLNQLFTIAVCGALGGVAVMLWWSGTIRLMLHPKFFLWVLLGGIALLVLVVLRAVAVWRSIDELAAVSDHVHDHEDCGHEHEPCHHHAHEHGHEHGWQPWRYVVLLLPVVLYLLNLPNQGFSADAGGSELNRLSLSAPESVRATGQASVGFVELQQASLTPESRDYYEGKTVTLTGQYLAYSPKRFTLRRYKIACCAADAVKLDAVIMVDDKAAEKVDPDTYRDKWVEVTGRIHFFPKPGSNEFITALILYPTKDEPISQLVKIIPPPATPWLN
jgi:uncharacterized repeat protein (TIGR03943 family)